MAADRALGAQLARWEPAPQPLLEAGLIAFGTDSKSRKRVGKHGNEFRQRGTIVWQDGNDHIFDIWLRWRAESQKGNEGGVRASLVESTTIARAC